MNLEIEKDFMLATLIAQMDEITKRVKKIEALWKQKDSHITPRERGNLRDHKAQQIEKFLSTILLSITKQYEALEKLKKGIERMKLVNWFHSRAI